MLSQCILNGRLLYSLPLGGLFPRHSTWLQIVTPSLHFKSIVTPSTMLLTWNILAPKWHQLEVTWNDARRWHGVHFWSLQECRKVSNYPSLRNHHLCDNFSLWLWILGLISRRRKQHQRFCHLLATGSCLG